MKVWQSQMDFGELAQGRFDKENHTFIAKRLAESPAGEIRLMESVCERENMRKALHRVEQNGGAPGVDGMKTTQLRGYLRRHWEQIKASLLAGAYKPLPVRRKEIENADGGVRPLGIPTVLDRLIQSAAADGTGAARVLGTHVLGVQLWVSTGTVATDGDPAGAVLRGGRLHPCGED